MKKLFATLAFVLAVPSIALAGDPAPAAEPAKKEEPKKEEAKKKDAKKKDGKKDEKKEEEKKAEGW